MGLFVKVISRYSCLGLFAFVTNPVVKEYSLWVLLIKKDKHYWPWRALAWSWRYRQPRRQHVAHYLLEKQPAGTQRHCRGHWTCPPPV